MNKSDLEMTDEEWDSKLEVYKLEHEKQLLLKKQQEEQKKLDKVAYQMREKEELYQKLKKELGYEN